MLSERALRSLALAPLFVAIYLVARTAAAAPTLERPALGLRGRVRSKALAVGLFFPMLEPVVRWLGARLTWTLTPEQRAGLDKKISLAGDFYGLGPEELVAASLLTAVAGLGVGVFFSSTTRLGVPIVFGCAVAGAYMPTSWLAKSTEERMKLIDRGLPHVVDLLALSMSAGLDFPGAVRQLVEKHAGHEAPLVSELVLVLQGLSVGRTRADVLAELAQRAPTVPVREFVAAVTQAEQRGSPIVPVLRVQAEVCRHRRTVHAEEAAAKAGVALIGPLALLFLCILLLVLGPIALSLKSGLANTPR